MSDYEKDLMQVENDYGSDQIDALEGLEAVRKRPGMYIGSTSQKGVTHLIWEVADNSVDEFVAGYGQDIWIHIAKDATVTIRDKGRGIPVGPHKSIRDKDGNPMDTLTVVCTKLHAGGKFNGENSGYKVSAGLHGVGIKTITALSDAMTVKVRRNGKIYQQKFSRCYPVTPVEIVGDCDINDTGTETTYHPDKDIFKQTLYPDCKVLQDRIAELVSLNAGLRIYYSNDSTDFAEEYYQQDGISGYARRLAGEKPLLYNDVVSIKGAKDIGNNRTVLVEIALVHDDDENGHNKIKTFANNINTHEGGFHLDGFRSAYRKILNKYAVDKKIIKENLSIKYLEEGLNAVVSVKVPEAEFEGQTKTKLGNAEVEGVVEEVFTKQFEAIVKEQKYDNIAEAIIMKSLKAKEADEAARKARSLVKAGNKVKKLALPGKLADCNPKSPYTELYIVEGDSAGGSAKQGRDREFQAILALRGKLLNTEKGSLERLLKSETITNIIGAIGTGIDAPKQKCEPEKARYDKVIIMTDADIDGAHIKTLLLTFFYNYMRPLVAAGMIYVAQSPLYRVQTKKGEPLYFMSDSEKKAYTNKHPNAEVSRFKGLGEMNADQLWDTTMDPATRTLVRVSLEDAERASEVIIQLMGTEAQGRRDFIEANAHKVDLTFM